MESELDEDWYDYLESDNLYEYDQDDHFQAQNDITNKEKYRTTDYSLNSPLIDDIMCGAYERLHSGKESRPGTVLNHLIRFMKSIDQLPDDPRNFHLNLFNFISTSRIDTRCSYRGFDDVINVRPLIVATESNRYLDELTHEFGSSVKDVLNILHSSDLSVHETVFLGGCFRHWGHPTIDYVKGLTALHENVTCKKTVDLEYMDKLASDLAHKLLTHHYYRTRSWPEIRSLGELQDLLENNVQTGTWPNKHIELKVGDRWHLIDFEPLFEVPKKINLADIIDDKSHSLGRKDLERALKLHKNIGMMEDRRVLLRMLKEEKFEFLNFLHKIDLYGFDEDDIVIGLRAKEREMKIQGRYFSLMSPNMIIYFVASPLIISESLNDILILELDKEHFIPPALICKRR
ncbi:hypothetical protein ACOME3_001973 [Neoechinorhynchus agilis]